MPPKGNIAGVPSGEVGTRIYRLTVIDGVGKLRCIYAALLNTMPRTLGQRHAANFGCVLIDAEEIQ